MSAARGRERTDPRGVPIAAADDDHAARLDAVLDALLSFRGNPSAALKTLLADDPDFVLARCVKIAFLLYQHQRGLAPKVRKELDAAAALPMPTRERGHLAALALWADGRLRAALDAYDALLLDHPRDLLAIKLGQDLAFFLGQGARIRDGIARALPRWSADLPGYGYLLGMYAFGLEECADYARAEDYALRALEINRRDAWAVHAGAHVCEMLGRREDGIRWLRERETDWADDNFFAVHQWWHLGLYYFDLQRYDQMLALYDAEIGPRAGELLLNRVDAAAALWRLHLAGQDVSAQAAGLAELWADQTDNAVSAFNDSHALMSFMLAGRDDAADALLAAAARASREDADNAAVLRRAGLDIGRALVAFGGEDYPRAVERLLPIRYAVAEMGGSHAQRDVYALTLIEAALRAGQHVLARALLDERVALRPHSAHDAAMRSRAA